MTIVALLLHDVNSIHYICKEIHVNLRATDTPQKSVTHLLKSAAWSGTGVTDSDRVPDEVNRCHNMSQLTKRPILASFGWSRPEIPFDITQGVHDNLKSPKSFRFNLARSLCMYIDTECGQEI